MQLIKQLITPSVQALVFIAGIYFQKNFRKKILKKKQWKPYTRIIVIAIITFLLMLSTYTEQCQNQIIGFTQSVQNCFYLHFDLFQIVKVLIANTILFGARIYQKTSHNSFHLNKMWIKSYIFAPLLEQLLFRATFYRVVHGKVPIYFLSFIFAISHIHRPLWKHFQKKHKNTGGTLFQTLFTFVFGYYSFFFLDKFGSIIPSIILHSYCNFLGPPSINKKTWVWHLICVICFFYYILNYI